MLTPEQREALIWVRNCLDKNHSEVMPSWMEFDMATWMGGRPSCGTRCCIGGSMDVYMAGFAEEGVSDDVPRAIRDSEIYYQLDRAAMTDEALYQLFYKWGDVDPTPENAVKAIDAYLNGHQDPWSAV